MIWRDSSSSRIWSPTPRLEIQITYLPDPRIGCGGDYYDVKSGWGPPVAACGRRFIIAAHAREPNLNGALLREVRSITGEDDFADDVTVLSATLR